jgi:hypothetical protein
MKKSILFLLVIISIFLASCSPQVTVTSQVTVTLPTATQTPEPSATPTAVYTPTPAKDIITNPSGIGFELDAQIEGQPEGVREVIDIIPPDLWDAKKKAAYEEKVDPTTYGFAEGETQLAYIPTPDEEYQKFRIELQRTSNPADVIAVFGSTDFVWKMHQMLDENGNPVFLNAGVIVEMRGGVPVNSSTVRSTASRLTDSFQETFTDVYFSSVDHYLVVAKDGNTGVQFNFIATGDGADGKGYVFFRDKDNRTVRRIYIEDFKGNISFVDPVH